jgi:FkbM family methyltransferase
MKKKTDLINGELEVIEHHIKDNNIVFDVGAYCGEWSLVVFEKISSCHIHTFEPLYSSFMKLKKNLSKYDNIIFNNVCVSNDEGFSDFWKYCDEPSLSTIYKRDEVEMKRHGIFQQPLKMIVPKISLDNYCKQRNIKNINFLKIDSEGSEFDILRGANRLLSEKKIDFIQFEYGGCFKDANITLENIFYFLKERGYSIGKITKEGIKIVHQFVFELEDYDYCNYLGALHNEDILY